MRFFLLLLLILEPRFAQADPILPRLMQPLKFASCTVTKIHSSIQASNLMSQKISVGDNGTDAYEILGTNWEGGRLHVESVEDYERALKAGYRPFNTYEISMASWFETTAKTLDFMAQAQPSKCSLFQTNDLKYLPVSILNWNDNEEKKQLDDDTAKGMTLEDCRTNYARHHIHDLKIKDGWMTFSDDDADYVVTELARGDFDHDGFEDSLIMVAQYYQGGSGRSYTFYVVSSTDGKQRDLKVVEFDKE